MRNIWVVARRDLKSYFNSPLGYVFIGAFMLIMGFVFYVAVQAFDQHQMRYQGFGGRVPSLTDGVVRPLFQNMHVILLMVAPFITMGLFASERKNHTIELLMTSPITMAELVLGKFLSSILFLSMMMACTGVFFALLYTVGSPDPGPILTSYLGTLLMVGSYLAFGLLFSAMTENLVIAVMATYVFILFFWLVSWLGQIAPPPISDIGEYLSLIGHFTPFSQGVLSTSDTFFFVSFIGTGLFLTYRVLDSFRWR